MSFRAERQKYFENNRCCYKECVFYRRGYCCCRIDEMYYNSDNTCGRYTRYGDREIATYLSEVIRPGDKLPTALLFNRGGVYNTDFEKIKEVEFYPHYLLVTFGDHNIRTTVYNDDVMRYLIKKREPYAVKSLGHPFLKVR